MIFNRFRIMGGQIIALALFGIMLILFGMMTGCSEQSMTETAEPAPVTLVEETPVVPPAPTPTPTTTPTPAPTPAAIPANPVEYIAQGRYTAMWEVSKLYCNGVNKTDSLNTAQHNYATYSKIFFTFHGHKGVITVQKTVNTDNLANQTTATNVYLDEYLFTLTYTSDAKKVTFSTPYRSCIKDNEKHDCNSSSFPEIFRVSSGNIADYLLPPTDKDIESMFSDEMILISTAASPLCNKLVGTATNSSTATLYLKKHTPPAYK
jgi:hypothetical protein